MIETKRERKKEKERRKKERERERENKEKYYFTNIKLIVCSQFLCDCEN